MAFISKEDFAGLDLNEFLSFNKLISPLIIKLVYILGVIAIVLFSLYTMFGRIHSFTGFLVNLLIGILILIFGNLSWRITCEGMIVLFNIFGELKKLNQK